MNEQKQIFLLNTLFDKNSYFGKGTSFLKLYQMGGENGILSGFFFSFLSYKDEF